MNVVPMPTSSRARRGAFDPGREVHLARAGLFAQGVFRIACRLRDDLAD